MLGGNKLKVKSNFFLNFCICEQKFYDLIIKENKRPIAIFNRIIILVKKNK